MPPRLPQAPWRALAPFWLRTVALVVGTLLGLVLTSAPDVGVANGPASTPAAATGTKGPDPDRARNDRGPVVDDRRRPTRLSERQRIAQVDPTVWLARFGTVQHTRPTAP